MLLCFMCTQITDRFTIACKFSHCLKNCVSRRFRHLGWSFYYYSGCNIILSLRSIKKITWLWHSQRFFMHLLNAQWAVKNENESIMLTYNLLQRVVSKFQTYPRVLCWSHSHMTWSHSHMTAWKLEHETKIKICLCSDSVVSWYFLNLHFTFTYRTHACYWSLLLVIRLFYLPQECALTLVASK